MFSATTSDTAQSVRDTEERTLNTWPALHSVVYDGWILRRAGGFSYRANSVSTLYGSAISLNEKVEYCQRHYERAGIRAAFKVVPAIAPEPLDNLLADRGYQQIHETELQRCSDLRPFERVRFASTASGRVRLRRASRPARAWLDAYARLANVSPANLRTAATMLRALDDAACFLLAYDADGRAVACALAAADRDAVGVYAVNVAPDARRQGIARAMMAALLGWARSIGARWAFLQVEKHNTPALDLYASLGFSLHYPYWYRVAPLDEGGAGATDR